MGVENKFAIIGGDMRMLYLANILQLEGYDVHTYGIDNIYLNSKINVSNTLKEAIEKVDIVICPLPMSRDNITINCKLSNDDIYIENLFKLIKVNQKVLAGYISNDIKKLAKKYEVNICDYFTNEQFVILNCIPTAEGAIKIAIDETPFTLHGSECLVLGFGRVGKVLANKLNALDSKVTVEARKQSDLAWIKSYGYNELKLENLSKYLHKFNIIFNTIPSIILNKSLLQKVNKDCLIIDLASKPGGVDFEEAKRLGIRTNWALSLPGKVAPYSAASAIKSVIFSMLEQKEV